MILLGVVQGRGAYLTAKRMMLICHSRYQFAGNSTPAQGKIFAPRFHIQVQGSHTKGDIFITGPVKML